MDLGIAGRKALVCGASSGLGRAIAEALAGEGVDVVLIARGQQRLQVVADCINQAGKGSADTIVADVSTEAGRARILESGISADILITNAGGPPVGDYRKLTRDDWIVALDGNMLAPIELINGCLDTMIERKFGRILNVTSHMVKSPVALLSLSNGARAGLTGYVAGVARDVAKHGVTVNNLLPGQFATPRLQSNHENFARMQNSNYADAQQVFIAQIPARRFGQPEEFGAMAAYLCGVQAGFVTGQNILLDGGQYPGLI